MSKKIILITGANGEIGQYLINQLKKNSENYIIALDLPDCKVHKADEYIQGSILDHILIKSIFKKFKINFIYHLAAILSTKAEKNPALAYEVNCLGTKFLIDLSVMQKRKVNFFFPSSIAVYNILKHDHNVKVDEKMFFDKPITIYGKNKLECERYGVEKTNENFEFRCIRFPGIISATSVPSGGTSDYAPEMIHAAAQNMKYICFVNKTTQIPFIVMPDAISAINQIMKVPYGRLQHHIYNITSFHPTVIDFYHETKKYFQNFNLSYKVDLLRQNIVNSWPKNINDENAKKDWGWSPKYNLKQSYKDYLIPNIIKYYESK